MMKTAASCGVFFAILAATYSLVRPLCSSCVLHFPMRDPAYSSCPGSVVQMGEPEASICKFYLSIFGVQVGPGFRRGCSHGHARGRDGQNPKRAVRTPAPAPGGRFAGACTRVFDATQGR